MQGALPVKRLGASYFAVPHNLVIFLCNITLPIQDKFCIVKHAHLQGPSPAFWQMVSLQYKIMPCHHLKCCKADDGWRAALKALNAGGRLKGGLKCKRLRMAKPACQRLLHFILHRPHHLPTLICCLLTIPALSLFVCKSCRLSVATRLTATETLIFPTDPIAV